MSDSRVKTSDATAWLDRILPDVQEIGRYEMCGPWSDAVPTCGLPGTYAVTRGTLFLGLEGRVHQLSQGDVVLWPASGRHRIGSDQRLLSRRLQQPALVEANDTRMRFGHERLVADVTVLKLDGQPLPVLPGLGLQQPLVLSAREQNRGLRLIVEGLIAELAGDAPDAAVASALCRALWLKALGPRLAASAVDLQIARAMQVALADPERISRVSDLARLAGLSRSRFTERFVASNALPPLRWLRRMRLAHGRRLMAREGLTMAEVAERLGYSDATAMRKAFRRDP